MSVSADGLEVTLVRPEGDGPVEWSLCSPEHTVMVWRRGIVSEKWISFDGKRSQRVSSRRSSVWVLPAGDGAQGTARGTTAAEYLQLSISPRAVTSGSLRQVISHVDPVLHVLLERVVGLVDRDDAVARLLRDALFDATRLHILDAYGTCRRAVSPEGGRELDDVTRDRLTEFLHDSLDREVNLAALAEIADMSVRSFRRVFRVAYGTTPHQYLLDLRVSRAQVLLTTTRLPAAEIGVLTGFVNPSHFATTFKQRTGASPTQFRLAAK